MKDLHPFKHWMRHTAFAPKGLLRYYVLELLSTKPMSGSEIMEEIERQSGGCWRPSPGSIYPLLAWLQDEGYIQEVPTKEGGKRCYSLTDKGRVFFEEHRRIKEEFDKKLKFFAPPFFGPTWLDLRAGKIVELREAMKRLAVALWGLKGKLEEKHLEQALGEVADVLDKAAREIEEIAKRFGAEK